MSSQSGTRSADALRGDDDTSPPRRGGGAVSAVASWADERTGTAKGFRYLMRKVFPDHWSFMLGEIAMYSLVILLLTGTFLTFWYVPSAGETVYNGSYEPLKGISMSQAYASTVDISYEVRGGLIVRQIHHWAALFFLAAILVHMCRVFFTGAFRKPREINWIIGLTLLMLSMIEGFAGYSLPDDLLSGTGLRAAQGFMLSIPVLGSYISYAVFGGGFPGEALIPRLFTVHVLLLPAIIVALFTAHIILVIVHKHTQYPGPGRSEKNVVGFPMMPVYIAKAGGFFSVVFGITALVAGLVTINPIWAYGPYEPTQVTAGSQPDWYMGFADGALRLLPGFLEFDLLGRTWSFNIFLGAIALIPVLFTIAGAYPFLEAWITGDKREHHILDRPRNAPTRTALGMAALSFYVVLFFASANDIMAIKLHLSINDVANLMRLSCLVLPPLVFWVTKRLCLSLQRRDRELVLHGRETGRIVRTADGRFFEAHEPLDEYTRWRLVAFESNRPLELSAGSDGNGVRRMGAAKQRLRAALSGFWFTDRIEAVTPAELAAAHHRGEYEALEAAAVEDSHPQEFGGQLHGGAEEVGTSHAYGDHEPR
ncbi:cytochrome bc1 complex cytochrome b subunit [Luteipulveratus flavus]|uniref:Cytochrome bc1 complex cytochrome b subunit n=1 Tax=Luteipulveratus flavus TaxID=3031728 RepID=A0ABT6C2W2_9MICO|nr:ubiquinol-cytochrome c reductase cytochrome b subunit [Luteipulveratus sp. YIM 133296]MDF8262647.1 ubiquinol-cytochrome c reductase cytochrome b subunit [Luteipulveratus sp. YIM 133296]